MVFSMFSEKTQPGYGVKRQVLLVLTACTCTPPPRPPQKRKCREGQEQRANMAVHNEDDGNENIAKDEFVSFQTLPIWNCIICQQQAISPGVES